MSMVKILAMQPGRELDALVAHKVMGFQNVRKFYHRYVHDNVGSIGSTMGRIDVIEYSTDISAAWEVVEKMQVNSLVSVYANPSKIPGERYTVHISKTAMGLNLVEIEASTVPEAICKSALLAVMKESEKE